MPGTKNSNVPSLPMYLFLKSKNHKIPIINAMIGIKKIFLVSACTPTVFKIHCIYTVYVQNNLYMLK